MSENKGIGFFEKYLSVWVALCIIVGIVIGQWIPAVPETLGQWEYANVSIPISFITFTALGLTFSAGFVPAEKTSKFVSSD